MKWEFLPSDRKEEDRKEIKYGGWRASDGDLTELNDRDENRDPSRRQPITPPRRLRLHLESEAPTGFRRRLDLDRTKKAAIMREKTLDWGKKKRHRLRREEECCKEGVSLAVSQLHSLAGLARCKLRARMKSSLVIKS